MDLLGTVLMSAMDSVLGNESKPNVTLIDGKEYVQVSRTVYNGNKFHHDGSPDSIEITTQYRRFKG